MRLDVLRLTVLSTAERSEAKAPARNGRANRATYALATKEELFELRPSNIKTSPKD